MATFSRGGVDHYYEIDGAGVPLLMIAGLASDSQSWQPIIADLSSRYRVITLDNRGAGRTTPQDAPASIRAMTDDCVALLDHLGLPSVQVLGHSMGGFVAQDFAIRHPEKVDVLVLAATSSFSPKRNNDMFADWAAALSNRADMKAWFRNLFYWIFTARYFEDRKVVEEALQYALAYPYPQSPGAFRNQVDAIAAFDSTGDLPRIKARTLVVAGREDLLFAPEGCRDLARAIADASFVGIDNAAHSIHVENPRMFTASIVGFLSSQGATHR